MPDQALRCRLCKHWFTWTEGEQRFYAERGLTQVPRRCGRCRAWLKLPVSQRRAANSPIAYTTTEDEVRDALDREATGARWLRLW